MMAKSFCSGSGPACPDRQILDPATIANRANDAVPAVRISRYAAGGLSNRLMLGVGSPNFGRTTLVRPIEIPFLKIQSSFLCGSHRHRRPPWTDRAGTKIRYPTRFSRLLFPASEPIFAFRPASDHRPRGSRRAPHTTEEWRQPSLPLCLPN